MDVADGGVEQGQVVESMQMGETRRAVIAALSEPDQAYDKEKFGALKQNWITEAVVKLQEPILGENGIVSFPTEANLSYPDQRAFVDAYLKHLGTPLQYNEIYNHVRTMGKNLPKIPNGQIDSPTDPRVAWVERSGGRGVILATTKIDGVQVELDAHRVADGPTTGWLHPVLHLSTK